MQIIPVLDLLGGRIVRGIAGRRSEYRPVRSSLTDSSKPIEVARAIRSHFDLSLFYLADLDAIRGSAPSIRIYDELQSEGFALWLDAGIQGVEDAEVLIESRPAGIIAGLETLAGPDELFALCKRYTGGRVIFSLDMKHGVALKSSDAWPHGDPFAIAVQAVGAGAKQMIVLDLAQVGMNQGTGTAELCARIKEKFPEISVCAGGGIRHADDVKQLDQLGVDSVLLASALHDGRLTNTQLKEIGC